MANVQQFTPRQFELLLETLAAQASTLSSLLWSMQSDAADGMAGEEMEVRLLAAAHLTDGIGMLADGGTNFSCRGSLQAWAVGTVWNKI